MAIEFRRATLPPLQEFTASAPDGAIIGLLGEDGAGQSSVLRLAAGVERPAAGQAECSEPRRLLGPLDALNLEPVRTLLLDHTLARQDAIARARAAADLERLRREGTTILLASHEPAVLRSLCDEVWWFHDGGLAGKGDPGEVLEKYNKHVAQRLKDWGATVSQPLTPSLRRGDGRARLLSLETLDAQGRPAMVWTSGEAVAVRISVRFEKPVDDPVVGIMIRTRIGFEVYGTNTELEKIRLGPCAAGETLQVTFRFRCDLCPQEYTLTAASHDPDGVWHDWLEDALAFSVTDSRYTAGVANLRAAVSVDRE